MLSFSAGEADGNRQIQTGYQLLPVTLFYMNDEEPTAYGVHFGMPLLLETEATDR